MHKPDRSQADPAALLLGFLDYYRSAVARKIEGLSEEELRTSRLPSGWSPLQLLNHLVYMERRWLVWGFLAEPIPSPSGTTTSRGAGRSSPRTPRWRSSRHCGKAATVLVTSPTGAR
ncbi:mycothiol transferase [Streptacidiphilus sp. PAMC 29251]